MPSQLIVTTPPRTTSGDNLIGRWRPSFTRVGDELYVFGGGGNVSDDVHVLHLDRMQWSLLKPEKGTPPSRRYGHTATLYEHSIIIFGGCDEQQRYCDDIHVFNTMTRTWTQPIISGKAPSARYLHTACVYNHKLYVYGGFARSVDRTYVLDEFAVLDLTNWTWTLLNPTLQLPARYNHSAVIVRGRMLIFGGKDIRGRTTPDLFVVDLNRPWIGGRQILFDAGKHLEELSLIKSQHFCDEFAGKLLLFGRYMISDGRGGVVNSRSGSIIPKVGLALEEERWTLGSHTDSLQHYTTYGPAPKTDEYTSSITGGRTSRRGSAGTEGAKTVYGFSMLDLETLEWTRIPSPPEFDMGVWNYFTVTSRDQDPCLIFLGNTSPTRPAPYDHFRDVMRIPAEQLGLWLPAPVSSPLSRDLGFLLSDPEHADFVISAADGRELRVHRSILAARWPHFRGTLRSGMVESTSGRLDLPEPFEAVQALITFVYTDAIDPELTSLDTLLHLLVLADLYLLPRLRKACCELLWTRWVSLETCGVILERACFVGEEGLKGLIVAFMFERMGEVLRLGILDEMDPETKKEFLKCVPEKARLDVNLGKLGGMEEI